METVQADERTPALVAYVTRTEVLIDLIALFTIWLSVIPFTREMQADRTAWIVARIVLSLIFLVDLVVRARLSEKPGLYVKDHPFAVLAVAWPPVRVILSVRLLRRAFQRGNIGKFLLVALVLLANLALICWAFERGAAHATIRTIGQSFWWSIVTVTTVGYGDYTPVTLGGRIAGVLVMGLGILTLAVVTATIASRFRDQADTEDFALPVGSRLDRRTAERLAAIRDGIDALLADHAATTEGEGSGPGTASEPELDA